MNISLRPRRARAVPAGIVPVGLLCVLAGCQSYERAPLNLSDHRAIVDQRIDQSETLTSFLDRLATSDPEVPTSFDPSDGLSLAEGETLALFYNADLRIARLQAGVALADFETAGLWQDPEFGFDGAEILSPSSPFEFGLMLNLTIPISGRLEVEKDRAGAAYEAELRRIVDAEWSTRADVRRAWAQWVEAEERLSMSSEVAARVERIRAITDRLEAAGELQRVQARLLRVELAERQADLVRAGLQAQTMRFDLLGLMGLAPDTDVQLLPDLPRATEFDTDDTTQRLIEANTALAVRRAEYQTAEESLRLEIRRQYPDITIGGGSGSEENDDRLLLGLSLPIPIFNANRAGIAEARALRDVARASAEIAFERLHRELEVSIIALDAHRAQREAYESSIVPMLEEQSTEIERLIDLGDVDTLLLLESVTRRFDAKSRLLELRLLEFIVSNDIARLLGPTRPREPAPVAHEDAAANDEQSTTPLISRPVEGDSQ